MAMDKIAIRTKRNEMMLHIRNTITEAVLSGKREGRIHYISIDPWLDAKDRQSIVLHVEGETGYNIDLGRDKRYHTYLWGIS